MRNIVAAACLMLAMASARSAGIEPEWAIVIHGGAGTISREALSAEQESAYRAALARATEAGAAVLKQDGTAIEAVAVTVAILEDDPLFNAGRGAVFTALGRNELDASIMDGRTLAVGAVAGVTRTRNPILLARRVMENSPHVMMIGEGADAFAREQGLEQVEPGWFFTERRWQSLEAYLRSNDLPIPALPAGAKALTGSEALTHDEGKKGTVGVVARDSAGNVAAGTSTGGITGKRWGRVGDSPIIGAGTYASNSSCAVSATGSGEYFIRLTVAREICVLVEHRGMTLQAAADQVIQKNLTSLGGDGGVIAVTPNGQMAWSFNTPGMYRARAAAGQPVQVSIYKDET